MEKVFFNEPALLLYIVLFLLLVFTFSLFYLYKEHIRKKYHGAYFLPTSKNHLDTVIKFAGTDKSRKVVDLGSGSGKILFALAELGFDTTGYEIDPVLVFITKARIYFKKLSSKTRVFQKNFWQEDLSGFDIIILFGIGHMIFDLEKKTYTGAEKRFKGNISEISISRFKFSRRRKRGIFI